MCIRDSYICNINHLNIYIMKFFIDTANLEQIREAYDLGVLDGVTTCLLYTSRCV